MDEHEMDDLDAEELRHLLKERNEVDARLSSLILELLDAGRKPAELARILGWSRQRMHSWLRSRRA